MTIQWATSNQFQQETYIADWNGVGHDHGSATNLVMAGDGLVIKNVGVRNIEVITSVEIIVRKDS